MDDRRFDPGEEVSSGGKGEPLLLLHGGLGSTGMFGPVHLIRPEHIVSLYHYAVVAAPVLARTGLPFLSGESGAKRWVEQMRERR